MDINRKFVWILLCTIYLIFLIRLTPSFAEDYETEWTKLNDQVVKIYHEGQYAEGVRLAEEAFRYAETHFETEHPNTLNAMNNLAFLPITRTFW